MIAGVLLAEVAAAAVVSMSLLSLGAHLSLIAGAILTKDYTLQDWLCTLGLMSMTSVLLSAVILAPAVAAPVAAAFFVFAELRAIFGAKNAIENCSI